MKDNPCALCAGLGKTCCQKAEVYITPHDAERITAFTGKEDFHEFRKPDNPAYADQDDDPTWAEHVFRSDGSRRVLVRDPDGNCGFLTETGCRLPLEIRPLTCRIYPYAYHAGGIYQELEEDWCPTHLLEPDTSLANALNMRLEDAEQWRRMLYTEILSERRAEK